MSDKAASLDDLQILCYPDPRLRQTAQPVEEITDYVSAVAERMIALMHEARGVGLAAPQVGIPIRLIVLRSLETDMETDAEDAPPGGLAFVNPTIVARDGYATEEEGCLSVPDVRSKIRRSVKVTVRAWDLAGKEHEITSEGMAARAWQHELDHLEGILFIDKMSPASKIGNARKLRDLEIARGEG